MKETKLDAKKNKTTAEVWVSRAKVFGEKCIAIQQDSKLSTQQKLSKQQELSNELTQEVQSDPHLKNEDKKRMLESIKNYMDDWRKIHDRINQTQRELEECSKMETAAARGNSSPKKPASSAKKH